MRLIDADAVIADVKKNNQTNFDKQDWTSRNVCTLLIGAPTIDAVPVVRGKWIIHKPFDSGRHNCNECIECSVCGTWFGHDCYEISNFCPNCGADIREDDEHESVSCQG